MVVEILIQQPYFNSHPHEEDDKNRMEVKENDDYFNSHPHEEDDSYTATPHNTQGAFQLTSSRRG